MGIEIIPAIDIIGGKCVRLSEGDYSRKTEYSEDPLELALRFQDWGVKRLHLVDLDGAREGRIVNTRILEKIASRSSLMIDTGGGIRSREDVMAVFNAGAAALTAGSMAVRNRNEVLSWIQEFGGRRIILGADVKNSAIAIQGWLEESSLALKPFLESWKHDGIDETICTDTGRDGLLKGPALDLYQEILSWSLPMTLIASGGVSSMADIQALEKIGVTEVIVGKAILEGRISEKEVRENVR